VASSCNAFAVATYSSCYSRRYYRAVDRVQLTEKDGFVIKSVLSIPIFDGEKIIIGVIQMLNKLNGKPFAENDRNSLEVRT